MPAAVFVTEWFRSLAEATRKGTGLPELNLISTPHPFDTLSKEEVVAVAEKLFSQAMAALTTGVLVRVR
ncbi:MAG: hypothetical protein Q7O66_02330 [Dehalococcoidia bacterium]|nr:hypothetical protein [Dehalococcoidia bacterium]